MEIPNSSLSFNDFIEYQDLEDSLKQSSSFEQTEVLNSYSTVGLEEKWFKNISNGESWRLVRPDPPFKGIWQRVV